MNRRLIASAATLFGLAGLTVAVTPGIAHAQASPAPADATIPVAAAPATTNDGSTSTTTTTTTTTTTLNANDPATAAAAAPVATTVVVQTPHPAPLVPAPRTTMHDFLDTRLTWTFGDDDVLTATGQRVPVSPLPSIGDRSQYQLFFDALNSRFAGRENLTHLVLYARAPGFIPRIVTEASLVLRVDLAQLSSGSGNLNQAFYDAGTYLRIQYQTNLARPTDGLSLTFFPFDTDRFRLGYLWDLSWGGNDIFPRRIGGAPGLRVSYDSGPFNVYAGFKTAQIVVPLPVQTMSADIDVVRVAETQYAGLAGFGIRFNDMVRFDASGGFFQQGRFDFPGVRGQPVYVFGGSARLVVNNHLPPSTSIDMLLYRNHPDFPMRLFAPETYTPGQFAWNISLEATAMDQHLADIDIPGSTTYQAGFAGAAQARIKYGYFGAGLTGLYRDVPFLLRNVPSFIPFQSIPRDQSVSITPEYFFAASIDYRIAAANLLPSLIVGLQLPATFSTSVTEGALQSQRTLVIRRAGNFSILPPGAGAVPILSARFALRWDLSSIFAVVGWVQYVRDNNGTLLDVDPTGTRQVRAFQNPDQLGFGLTAQARF